MTLPLLGWKVGEGGLITTVLSIVTKTKTTGTKQRPQNLECSLLVKVFKNVSGRGWRDSSEVKKERLLFLQRTRVPSSHVVVHNHLQIWF